MAKKKRAKRVPKPPPEARPGERPGVTAERFTRLHRLVRTLGEGTKTREQLTTPLGLDVRGFYRDLEVLRTFGIEVTLAGGQYSLVGGAEPAMARLPYPDPHLTLGEALQLAKGRGEAQRKLREQIDKLSH